MDPDRDTKASTPSMLQGGSSLPEEERATKTTVKAEQVLSLANTAIWSMTTTPKRVPRKSLTTWDTQKSAWRRTGGQAQNAVFVISPGTGPSTIGWLNKDRVSRIDGQDHQ